MAGNPTTGESERSPAGAGGVTLIRVLGHVDWRAVLPLGLAVGLGLWLVWVLPYLAKPLELLVVAVTLAEALAPPVTWLDRRMRRSIAIGIVYAALAVVAIAICWLVIPALLDQAQALMDRAPLLLAQGQQYIDRWDRLTGGRLAGLVAAWPDRLGRVVVRVPMELATGIFDTLLIVFLSVYWLAGASHIEGFMLSLIKPRHRAKAALVLHEIGRNMGGYVRGTVINAAIMGALAWVGLMAIGVPFAVVLGVLTMLGELVPILGPVMVGILVALIALMRSVELAVGAVLLYTALIQLEGHILTPNIMARQTNVPQTLVLFAIVVGGGAGGLLGVVVAVPVAAAFRVFVLEVLAPWERRLAGAEPRPPAPSAPPMS